MTLLVVIVEGFVSAALALIGDGGGTTFCCLNFVPAIRELSITPGLAMLSVVAQEKKKII